MSTETNTPTEFGFVLPHGYVDPSDSQRVRHRNGTMRLATARDELAPLVDLRVRENPAYLGVLLLGLVVTRIGDITQIRPEVIENLFAADLAYLQEMYERINAPTYSPGVQCPSCGALPAEGRDHARDRLGESAPTR